MFKRVALGRIRCFCLSQAARDVQQVQETTNSPLRTNGVQDTDYLPHMLREEGLIAKQMGIYKFLQKHREMNIIERRPSSGRLTKMSAARHVSEDSAQLSHHTGMFRKSA